MSKKKQDDFPSKTENNKQRCCCVHPDARACLKRRHPEIARIDDTPGGDYNEYIDEVCECWCHDDDDDDDDESDCNNPCNPSTPL